MSTPSVNHRHTIRFPGYDYRQAGDYFITLVTYNRLHLFGHIDDAIMYLSNYGQIAYAEWFKTVELRSNIELDPDEFVVMPNHIHGIIHINDTVNSSSSVCSSKCLQPPLSGSLSAIIRAYKSAVTYAINSLNQSRGAPVWQRNYYEHIIDTDNEYLNIAAYIQNNPENWLQDAENN